jgi:hypothetical protein
VRVGRLRVLGLLFPLVAAAGCTSPDATPGVERADAAVPDYAPPSGTPTFCTELAGTTHLAGLSTTVGILTADPDDVESGLELTAAADELQAVLDDVRDRPAMRASLHELVDALRRAQGGRLTDAARVAITTGLDEVGREAQAICGFPA